MVNISKEEQLKRLEDDNARLRKAIELLDGPFPISKDAKDDDTCFLPPKAYKVHELREINRIYFQSVKQDDNLFHLYTYFKNELYGIAPGRCLTHSAYAKIMALGKSVIPFILRDLEKDENFPGWWFRWILPDLTGEGTSGADGADWWVKWGREKGLI